MLCWSMIAPVDGVGLGSGLCEGWLGQPRFGMGWVGEGLTLIAPVDGVDVAKLVVVSYAALCPCPSPCAAAGDCPSPCLSCCTQEMQGLHEDRG